MANEIKQAVQLIAEEKGLTIEAIVATIEAALAAAYRKDFGERSQNIKVDFDLESGKIKVFDVKIIVEDELVKAWREREAAAAEARASGEEPAVESDDSEDSEERRFNPKTDIGLTEAQEIRPKAVVGEEIRTELEIPGEFGRMAAQTAKQVIIQKIREAEHANVYEEFNDKVNTVLMSTVQRRDARAVYLDIGRATAIMPPEEQIPRERYTPGERLKVYIVSVGQSPKGPQIIASRSHPEVVKQIFSAEIPEIQNGLIVIKGIAREAGSRSKVAVEATDPNVDPIGSCVGQRGTRVQTIISELGGEKIDIIEWSEDPVRFITNSLSPAKVLLLETDEEARSAIATVAEDQLSLAIGKGGQNVRLAARLTGWRIDIRSEGGEMQAVDEGEAASDEVMPETIPAVTDEGDVPSEPVIVDETKD
jgi:transcription termination/antitermination protein NusA